MHGTSPIGRELELARLDALLDAASGGAALLVRGPRGCGVSTLIDVAAERAAARGMGVLHAAGVEAESGFAYASLHQLLRPLRRAIAELPGAPGEALRACFGLSDAPVPAPEAVAQALVALASGASEAEALLVCVDEWQWIDAESRAAITSFVRRGASLPVAVLLGGHADGPPDVDVLEVGPLDPGASERVIDACAPGLPLLVRARVLREAAGRPLALVELPAAYAGADDGELLSSWAPLTPALEEAFAAGLERLEPATAQAVLIAALDDGGRVPDILAAASRLAGRPLAQDVLEPAVSLGLVELAGDRLAFAQPVTRAAVRRASNPAARRAGHEAFAFVVAATDPDRATWHRVVGAAGLDPELAAELEAVSWRSRDGGDYERAAAGLRRAAHLTPAGPARSRRLVAAAELAHEIGGVEIAERLLDDVRTEELDALGRARWVAARTGALREGRRRTETLLTMASEALAGGERELALRLRWIAATELQALGRDPAPALAGLGEDAAPARGAREVRGAAMAGQREVRGAAMAGAGEPRGAALAGPGESQRAAGAGPAELAVLGHAALVAGDPHRAASLLDRALEGLRAQCRRTLLGQVLALSAWVRLTLAELDRARADGAEASRLSVQVRQPLWGAAAEAVLATVAALQGDEGGVERHAAAAERVALPVRAAFVLAVLQQARGVLALGAGRPAEAFAHLRRPFDPADPACDPAVAAAILGDLAEAATDPEERAFVRRLLAASPRDRRLTRSSAENVDARVAQSPPRASVAAAHAALVLADDDADAAFERALQLIGDEWPLARARILLVHGMRLRRHRRMADSREPLRAAAAGFAAIGAGPWADRAQRELAATAETAHRGEDDLDRLTPQELEIARMAARGMTNPAIAADLALSPRTVRHHLARIFPKLEVTSRAGLSAALERLGY